jgi:hypothetical protein
MSNLSEPYDTIKVYHIEDMRVYAYKGSTKEELYQIVTKECWNNSNHSGICCYYYPRKMSHVRSESQYVKVYPGCPDISEKQLDKILALVRLIC